MYDAHVAELPTSWAELQGVEHTAGAATNGHGNGNGSGVAAAATANGGSHGAGGLPGSFVDGKAVRTVYGLVPLKCALDWPVFASYDELAGCAAWMGGRIPTFEEARSIYSHVDALKTEQAVRKLGKTVPAVNGSVAGTLPDTVRLSD